MYLYAPIPDSERPEEESLLEQEHPEFSLGLPTSIGKREGSSAKEENGTVDGESGVGSGGYDEVGRQISSNCFDQRRKRSAYRDVLENYNELRRRSKNLEAAKSKILSYYPGAWIEAAGGMKLSDYDVPKTTSLLLIGPKGSGKSSLVNRISRVFEDDKFAPDRAQISYNMSVGDGTYFLQEYMIPRDSTYFCVYDTRSLSDESSTNKEMLTHWMTRGVRHGELVTSDSDSSTLKTRLKCKARQSANGSHEIRMVNFVVFVINGVSILKSMYAEEETEKMYSEMVAATFSCPFLSFKDDKPVVVVTHGDLLSVSDSARVRVHLGELLGISPTKQIFDIPGIPSNESSDKETELAIVDMLRYSLEHADRNLPGKEWVVRKVTRKSLPACLCLLIALLIAIIAAQHSIYSTQTHCAHKHHVPACPPPPPVANLHRNLQVDEIGRAVSVGDGLSSNLTRQEKLRLISTQESLVEVHEGKNGNKSFNQKHLSPLPPLPPQEEKKGKKASSQKHSTHPPPLPPQEEKAGKKASNEKHSTPTSLPPTPNIHIEWHSIRHIWVGSDYD